MGDRQYGHSAMLCIRKWKACISLWHSVQLFTGVKSVAEGTLGISPLVFICFIWRPDRLKVLEDY